MLVGNDEHAVFLSGNGPLVRVLREALVRDEIQKGIRRKEAKRKADTFIQNIHQFRDEYIDNPLPPLERVVIFDEAQRAWTQAMTADFMKRKRGKLNFNMSEPEFLISVMDRHKDWAVIICLIGGGQEINRGEAGLSEWFLAIGRHFSNWNVYVSQQITNSEFLMQKKPKDFLLLNQLMIEDRLHLAVSVRSFRSEKVSAFIKAILDCDLTAAQLLNSQLSTNYPIVLTRDIKKHENGSNNRPTVVRDLVFWLAQVQLGLRPEGIFVNANIEVDHWFLDERNDVRSSYSLEGVATEFDIQGLELDWAIVSWDADLRFTNGLWEYRNFKGNKWLSINDSTRKQYLKNAYRVLLTRSRQGMVIFVPVGDHEDETRLPSFYDQTSDYLHQLGIPLL